MNKVTILRVEITWSLTIRWNLEYSTISRGVVADVWLATDWMTIEEHIHWSVLHSWELSIIFIRECYNGWTTRWSSSIIALSTTLRRWRPLFVFRTPSTTPETQLSFTQSNDDLASVTTQSALRLYGNNTNKSSGSTIRLSLVNYCYNIHYNNIIYIGRVYEIKFTTVYICHINCLLKHSMSYEL